MPDQTPMQRALTLAEATIGLASPNPQVGCVLTLNNQTIGEGAHLYDNRDHAEIVALKQAGPQAKGATAFVTLEPCSHHGRTGPCADALIAAGIARCVIATADPNPQVSGRGIAKLRAAGIQVEIGLEQPRARRLNDPFALSITRNRPFIHLKSALSIDGRLAPLERTPGTPHWLTGPASRAEVHRLRHASDALLTGIGTILADDPLLTDRSGLPRRRPLLRIVLDSDLRTPLTSALVRSDPQNLWLFCAPHADPNLERSLTERGVRVTRLDLQIQTVLAHLHEAQLLSVLLEAGPTLNAAFLRAGLVDRATLFYAPTELGPASLPFAATGPTPFALQERMTAVTRQTFGEDVCVSGLLHNPWPD